MKGPKLKTLMLFTPLEVSGSNRERAKLLMGFISLFLLDLVRPLGYSLVAEFVFLGIIFVSLNEDLLPALLISAIFGLLCDSFNPGIKPLNLVEFPFICLLNHYLFSYFRLVNKRIQVNLVKNSLALLALIIHIIINSIHSGLILPLFWIKFIMQSILIYSLINYSLGKDRDVYPLGVAQ